MQTWKYRYRDRKSGAIAEDFDKRCSQRRVLLQWRYLALQKQELRGLEEGLEEKKRSVALGDTMGIWRKQLALVIAERHVTRSGEHRLVRHTWNNWSIAM
jgi:hypothetical protein